MAQKKQFRIKPIKGGVSPFIIGIVIVVILAVAGAVFFLTQGSSILTKAVPASNMIPKVSESDFSEIEDPLLRKHFAAQANQSEYKIISTSHENSEASTIQVQMENNTFKYRMTSNSPGYQSDMIIIGDTTYIKDFSDNTWWKQTSNPEDTSSSMEEFEEFIPNTEDLKSEVLSMQYNSLGEEACGDLMCYKYEQLSPSSNEGSHLFWFDTEEYLLRKEESIFGDMGFSNEYSYEGISISEPSPTKDVPEGRNIYEFMITSPSTEGGAEFDSSAASGSLPSEEEIQRMMEQFDSEEFEQMMENFPTENLENY